MTSQLIFISYSRRDEPAARRLYQDLRNRGLKPWLDKEDILPGQQWRPAIRQAIEGSRYFIALISSHSVSKQGFVNKEIVGALDLLDTFPESEVFLIPARLDDCEPSHSRLRDLNWVDMFPDWNTGLERVLKAIEAQDGASVAPLNRLLIDDVLVKNKSDHIVLDVRMRNTAQETVNITRADLHILSRAAYLAAYQASASYDLIVEGEHNVIPVGHVLSPGEVDSFLVRVGFTPFNTSCGFTGEMLLHYNGDQVVTSKSFTFKSIF